MPNFTADEWSRMCHDVVKHAAANRARMIQAIAKMRSQPLAMESAEKLHERLTRAFGALHRIAASCLTRPEEATEEERLRGYRNPCKSPQCGPCAAFQALIIEG